MFSIDLRLTKPSTRPDLTSLPQNRSSVRMATLLSHSPRPSIFANPALSPPNPRMVEDGYGDWIVQDKTGKEVELGTYRKIAAIFKDYHPLKWKNNEDRIQSLKSKVRQINPQFELTFIPRSLYELTFLRQAIDEDIEKCTKLLRDQKHLPCQELWETANEQCQRSRNSWCSPIDTVALAHRLNGIFNQLLKESPMGPQEHTKLKTLLEDQISFLRHIYCNPDFKEVPFPWLSHIAPPAASFIYDDTGRTRPIILGVSDEQTANIIRNAFELECSSPGKVLLYRGANRDFFDPQHSLSFGTSLFAGGINDHSACAFWYMRKLRATAVPIPIQNFPSELIYYSRHSSTIEQLLDSGEFFHGRTKFCKQPPNNVVTGVQRKTHFYFEAPNSLKSTLSQAPLSHLFNLHLKKPVDLKAKL